jgi:asparagine synthase (glutamine-hydrolysing)
MCGIAGIIDLAQQRAVPDEIVRRMARALVHRGPDEEGFFFQPGVALASRRLSIVGLADGQQPVTNEEGNVVVVFNGELFDHLEKRAELEARGHRLVKHCDTEVIPHLWEEHQQGMFERLRGQFAIALWDQRGRRLLLGRDRFGICPLYWTRQGDWLLFASEIKALLASGMVPARPDRRGIDHIFTFSALPGPITCFEGVQLLRAGHFLEITPGSERGRDAEIADRAYWEMDFPDLGDEERGDDPRRLVDEFEQVMLRAVDTRLKADVPVGSYLSGGVDSSMIAALACHLKGSAINTYTIRVDSPELDELDAANLVARHIKTKPPIVQEFRAEDAVNTYPELIQAAEAPVIDTSCAALLQLARRVHECGQKVVLTGEGADEWLVGYPWYKAAKLIEYLDILPGVRLSDVARRGYLRLKNVPQYPREFRRGIEEAIGGPNAWIDSYGLLGLSKLRFYSESMHEVREQANPWADLQFPLARAKRWHPLHRGIWVAGRVTLAGTCSRQKATAWPCIPRWKCGIRFWMRRSSRSLPGWTEVEAAWFPRQASAASAGGALAAGVRLQAAQSDLPRAAGQLPHGSGANVRRPALKRRILAPHGLFRRSRGASLAACFSPDAGGLAAASLRGGRPCRRGGHAALAPPLH